MDDQNERPLWFERKRARPLYKCCKCSCSVITRSFTHYVWYIKLKLGFSCVWVNMSCSLGRKPRFVKSLTCLVTTRRNSVVSSNRLDTLSLLCNWIYLLWKNTNMHYCRERLGFVPPTQLKKNRCSSMMLFRLCTVFTKRHPFTTVCAYLDKNRFYETRKLAWQSPARTFCNFHGRTTPCSHDALMHKYAESVSIAA